MTTRHFVGILILFSASIVAAAPLPADAPGAAKRPLAFPIPNVPPGASASSLEGVVNFGPPLTISALAFTADGKTLAAGGYREVLLWDLENAKLAKRIGTGQLDGMVRTIGFADQGKTLAVGEGMPDQKGSVKLFNIETGELSATFEEPQKMVYCLAVSADEKFLAAGCADSRVYVWDLAAKKLAKDIEAHQGCVQDVSFSADGKRMATAAADKTIRIWDTDKWELLIRYDLPAKVNGVAISNDGAIVIGAVGGPEEWALRFGRIENDLKQPANRKPNAQAFPTGSGMPLDIVWPAKAPQVYLACSDNSVRAYRSGGGGLLATWNGHTDWVFCVATTPDGSKLASGSADGTVKLWNGTGGKPWATLVQLTPCTDQWLIMTRQGFFSASSPELIDWKTTDSSISPQELTKRYHNPDRVRQLLAEIAIRPFAFQPKANPQPTRPEEPPKKPGGSPKNNKKDK